MIEGTPKFNSLQIMEIEASFLNGNITVTGKAAFRDTTTGNTHGWTKGEGAVWSEETRAKLQELRDLMEQDLATLHFNNGPVVMTAAGGRHINLGGLSEHLEEDANQV